MSKFFVGVDPGATGAIAMMDEMGFIAGVWDYPGDPHALRTLLVHIQGDCIYPDTTIPKIELAVIEKVSAMPKQGVVSMFKFGQNYGIWQMAIASMGWPYELITPQRWRQVLDSSVPQKPSKDDLMIYARRRWPRFADEYLTRKKDHGRCEAVLIADFARLKFLGRAK